MFLPYLLSTTSAGLLLGLLQRRMELTRLEMTAADTVSAVVSEASLSHKATATRAARKWVALPFIQPMQLAHSHKVDLHLQCECRRPVVHIRVMRRHAHFGALSLLPRRSMRDECFRNLDGAAIDRREAPQASVEVVWKHT